MSEDKNIINSEVDVNFNIEEEREKESLEFLQSFNKLSKNILMYFIATQVFGVVIMAKAAFFISNDMVQMIQSNNGDPMALLGLKQPTYTYTTLENFLAGFSLSASSFFLGIISLAAFRLKRPYRFKSYKYLTYSFPLMVITFLFSERVLFTGDLSKMNIGVVGSIVNILLGYLLFIRAQNKILKKWSVEYLPPSPDLSK